MAIVKQGMPGWQGNDGKMTSQSNFKRFSQDLIRGFYYEFDVIWEVWLPWVLIWLKLDIVKQGMSDWPGNDGDMTSHSISRLSSCKRLWSVYRGYICQ